MIGRVIRMIDNNLCLSIIDAYKNISIKTQLYFII